ncbi:MAG: GNAT family N-acetyltransferase [Romboutsia sp.]|nr:GNAT family N-acetyltransferase [Romboutsia sp.]
MNSESNNIRRLEEIALNAFPAISTEFYDGWILRYSNGYTFRGNSVNPLYKSEIDLKNKIEYCERKYCDKNLPCVFKMTDAVDSNLDKLLADRGYTVEKAADIMECCTKDFVNLNEELDVNINIEMTDSWLNNFLILNGTIDKKTKNTASGMLKNIQNKIFCASIIKDNKMVACGLGVLEDCKIGLYDIRVLEEYRRKGLAFKLCSRIIQEGIKAGAHSAYLQVASTNSGAIKLYEKLGFTKTYTYWYRVKKDKNYNGKTD